MSLHVMVTGATGFLGSRLVRRLVAQGERVTVLVRDTARWDRLADVRDRLRVQPADAPADRLFAEPVDRVLHAATCYDRRGEDAATVRRVNLEWPRRLLEAAADAGVPWFINCDTSLPTGLDPYADWKQAFRAEAHAAAHAGRIGVLNLRFESLIGAGDDDTKFVTRLLRAFLAGAAEFAMTAGEQSRDYLHVDDAAEAASLAMAALAQRPREWWQVEVGRGAPVRIRDFAERLRVLCDAPTVLRFGALPYRQGELMAACADTAALTALGWAPRLDLDASLRATIEAERRAVEN